MQKKPFLCVIRTYSISPHILKKVFILETYKSLRKFEMICLSETYFDSIFESDSDKSGD